MMKTPEPGNIYKHYKGQRYKILIVAKSTENLEWLVVYEALYENSEGQFWVRPLAMFQETVLLAGKAVPRFQLID